MTDGEWTVDRAEVRVDPVPNPSVAILREHESRGKESPSQTLRNSEPRLDAQVAVQSRTTKGHKPLRSWQKANRRMPPHGKERLGRRDEVINETLAEEAQRGEQRKKRSDYPTAGVPESEPAASAAPEPREAPVEPDPNPKRRLLMKSASSTASDS